MKILAVDTATQSCSAAVMNNDMILSEIISCRRQTHSKHLMDMIDSALKLSGLSAADMDGFAVTKGPGSFTGLRIGISTIKGMALASGRPIAGISNMQVLASKIHFTACMICVLLDARKGEVYTARYRLEDGYLKQETREQVLSPEKAISSIDEPCIFTGNGAEIYQDIISEKLASLADFAPSDYSVIRASDAARLALKRFQANDIDNLAAFAPSYIRSSDAQLNFGTA